MDSAKIRMAGSLLWKPIAGVIALIFLLVLVFWMWESHSPSLVSNRQMTAVIRQAGHGKVEFRQSMDVDGIPAAQVRYPNHSLHTVFFFAHDGKIRGIVVGGHVYTDHGTPWVVAWPTPLRGANPLRSAKPHEYPQRSDSHSGAALPGADLSGAASPGTSPAGSSPAGVQPPAGSIPVPVPGVPTKTTGSAAQAPNTVGTMPITTEKTVLRYAAFAHGFVWGHDDHTPIDALVDPNCLYCHRWFVSEKAAVNAGKISFRIIPVAALKPSSVPRAIEIMSAKNPLQLWLQNDNGFHAKTESGGISTTLPKNKAMQKAVAVNTAILYAVDNHHPFTPTFVDVRTGQVWMGANHDQELAHAFVQ